VVNGLSVDVEEWFHICGVGGPLAFDHWPSLPSRVVETTRRLLDLLARHDTRATFFVLGWVAERHPDLMRDILSAGHDIGSHGHTHRRIYELTGHEFADELIRCRRALAAAGVDHIDEFRAPEWSINDRSPCALEILAAWFARPAWPAASWQSQSAASPRATRRRVDRRLRIRRTLDRTAGPLGSG
jgi:peptidoglycan/xylan/chitin deacetylase (PgdA/CDA1 family)